MKRHSARPSSGIRSRLALSLAVLLLAACQSVRGVDERLRRIDLLDRVFEPERFRMMAPAQVQPARERPPAPAPEVAQPITLPPWPAAELAAEPPRPWFEPVERAPEPAPEPEPAPPPDPTRHAQLMLRQEPWLSRFWSALTPAQRQRVERRLGASEAGRQTAQAGIPAAWDGMGLSDRVSLVFGPGGR